MFPDLHAYLAYHDEATVMTTRRGVWLQGAVLPLGDPADHCWGDGEGG